MVKKLWLVVVRAGDRSLHEAWLKPEKYDCIIAYFGDDKNKWQRDDITRLDVKGGKWDGLYRVFSVQPELLDKYRLIWLPDDDIDATPEAVEKMFLLHERYDLKLSQPTMAPNSYFGQIGYLQNPAFHLRYSNSIELMMPCMSVDLLRRVLPLFEDNKTGYGMNGVWPRAMPQPFCAAALLDEVSMRHTRHSSKGELDMSSSKQDTQRVAHLMPKQNILFYGGILRNGREIMGERAMMWPMFRGWRKVKDQMRYNVRNRTPLSLSWQQMRRQWTQRADFTPILGEIAPQNSGAVMQELRRG